MFYKEQTNYLSLLRKLCMRRQRKSQHKGHTTKASPLASPPPPQRTQGLGLTRLTRYWASDLLLRAAARQTISLQYYCSRILVDLLNIIMVQYNCSTVPIFLVSVFVRSLILLVFTYMFCCVIAYCITLLKKNYVKWGIYGLFIVHGFIISSPLWNHWSGDFSGVVLHIIYYTGCPPPPPFN